MEVVSTSQNHRKTCRNTLVSMDHNLRTIFPTLALSTAFKADEDAFLIILSSSASYRHHFS